MKKVCVTDYHYASLDIEKTMVEEAGAAFVPLQLHDEAALAAVAGEYDVFLNTYLHLGETAFAGMKPGAVVVRYGIGYDNVDIPAAERHGVTVCNIPDYGLTSVANFTIAAITGCLRQLFLYDAAVRAGKWPTTNAYPVHDFPALTVGLLGFGGIARRTAGLLTALEFTVLANDPFVPAEAMRAKGVVPASREEVLSTADCLSLHMPLTSETRHVVNAQTIAAMKDGACLVNTARGALVDHAALAAALSSGKLAAAVIDVFETEPLPEDSPLRAAPNLTLTPHVAWYSEQSLRNIHTLAAQEVVRAVKGEPLRCPVTKGPAR